MSLDKLISRLDFRSAGDGWPVGSGANGASFVEMDVTDAGRQLIKDSISKLYQSPTMAAIFEKYMQSSTSNIRFSEFVGSFTGAVTFGNISNGGWIDINTSEISNAWWFNDRGVLVNPPAYIQIGHELLHYLEGLSDAGNNLGPTDAEISGAGWDFKGSDTVKLNSITKELGIPELVRSGYQPAGLLSSVELSPFKTEYSYTNGAIVDITVVSSQPSQANEINLSHRSESILIFGLGGEDYLQLGSGNDFAYGGDQDDIIIGGAGNDHLYGESGNDDLDGGDGDDVIEGGDGADILRGGAGDDTINGGNGEDIIHTGSGRDIVDGGAGADTVYGEGGYQTFTFKSSKQKLDIKIFDKKFDDGKSGFVFEDQMKNSDANGDKIIGFKAIEGSSLSDIIHAESVFVDISGGAGDDLIYGSLEFRESDDEEAPGVSISGGEGNDNIIGGIFVKGGAGNDQLDGRGWIGKTGGNGPFGPMPIGVIAAFERGFGHDLILGDHDAALKLFTGSSGSARFVNYNFNGIRSLSFEYQNKSDFDFIYEETVHFSREVGMNSIGNLAIVDKNSGDSVLIRDVVARMYLDFDENHLVVKNLYSVSAHFADGGYLEDSDITVGSTGAFDNLWGV